MTPNGILCVAQEALTCTGDESPGIAARPGVEILEPPQPAAPRWADLALALVVVAVGIFGLLRLRARRRRLGPAPPVELAPVLAGAGLGVLCALSLLFFGRPIGASGGFEHAARGTLLSWQVWLVAGVFGGALLASLATRGFRISAVPSTWAARHGPSVMRRFAVTFAAAAVMELAALIAGGCTSGLALSGGIGLAPGAFVFMAAMFATGMPAAWLAHGTRRTP